MNSERKALQKGADADQLTLPLPGAQPNYSREKFLISSANEAALRACEAWLQSDAGAMIICGPTGAGKTHLAHIIAAENDGAFLDRPNAVQTPADKLVVIDDLPGVEPKQLLAILSDLEANDQRVLLVGAGQPREWADDLKDLRTRLEAMPRALMGEPDGALIRAVIVKAFNDRQIKVAEEVIDFAIPRLSLSFAAAHHFVAMADKIGLQERRKITIPLAQKIIDNLSEGDGEA